jgi:hypothetical protein
MSNKKWLIAISILFLVFIILNPDINRFKEYSGLVGRDSHYIRRTSNFLIFSLYQDNQKDKKYIGLLMNFIDVTGKASKSENQVDSVSTSYTDTITKNPSFYELMGNKIFKVHDTATYTTKQLINYGYSEDQIRKAIYNGSLVPLDSISIETNRKLKLWAKMSENDLFKESFEKFQKKYNTQTQINFLYNGLHNDALYTKSREEFFKQFFPDIR